MMFSWLLIVIGVATANFAAIGPFDKLDIDPLWAAEAFMKIWVIVGVAALVSLLGLLFLKRAPLPLWLVAGGGLLVALVGIAVNRVFEIIVLMSV